MAIHPCNRSFTIVENFDERTIEGNVVVQALHGQGAYGDSHFLMILVGIL